MPLTPAPTHPTYSFVVVEVSGAGGAGKTHFLCSSIGCGPMAYFHSAERPGTLERFAAWGASNNCQMDWSNFGFMIDSRWSSKEVARRAEERLQEFNHDIDEALSSGTYATVGIDSLSFLKQLIFLSHWGTEPPVEISSKGNEWVDRRKVYGPVNEELERLYAKFRNQPLRKGPNGRLVGTSLIMTSEGKAVYTEKGEATDEYIPRALGRLEFVTDLRCVVAGPAQKTRANTITFHKGGGSIAKLNKPQPRMEFPEALAYLLGVDPIDWGRNLEIVPPSFAPQTCPGPRCGKEGLEHGKVDGRWVLVEADGSMHQCPPAPAKPATPKGKAETATSEVSP